MHATMNDELRLRVPMDTLTHSELRRRTWVYLATEGNAAAAIEDILVALHEAVANSLRHSCAGSDIQVCVQASRSRVVVEVVDSGKGIDPSVAIPPRPPGLSSEGGRGLFMIWSLMSSVRLGHSSGTHLVMVKDSHP